MNIPEISKGQKIPASWLNEVGHGMNRHLPIIGGDGIEAINAGCGTVVSAVPQRNVISSLPQPMYRFMVYQGGVDLVGIFDWTRAHPDETGS
jgi:hypothetical protein